MNEVWSGGMANAEPALLLSCINKLLGTNYKTLEELRNGVVWCQLMNVIFPNTIKMLAKVDGEDEEELCHNILRLKSAFEVAALEDELRIRDLIQRNRTQILQMAQFFIELYDRYSVKERTYGDLPSGSGSNEEAGLRWYQLRNMKLSTLMQIAKMLGLIEKLKRQVKTPQHQDQPQTPPKLRRSWDFLRPIKALFWKKKSLELLPVQKQLAERKPKVKAKYQTTQKVVDQALKAVRWSPTSRRNYALPKRAARLRQNCDCVASFHVKATRRPMPRNEEEEEQQQQLRLQRQESEHMEQMLRAERLWWESRRGRG